MEDNRDPRRTDPGLQTLHLPSLLITFLFKGFPDHDVYPYSFRTQMTPTLPRVSVGRPTSTLIGRTRRVGTVTSGPDGTVTRFLWGGAGRVQCRCHGVTKTTFGTRLTTGQGPYTKATVSVTSLYLFEGGHDPRRNPVPKSVILSKDLVKIRRPTNLLFKKKNLVPVFLTPKIFTNKILWLRN